MRDFKGMKRQRGRNRSPSGGKPQQHNANRAFDSNGPEGIKVRGAAQSVYEKYQQLARDATSGGDRVLAENYLQHAEHYFRVLRALQPQRPVSDFVGKDNYAANFEIDFEAEPEEMVATESAPEAEPEGQREERFYNQNGQNGQNSGQRQFRDDRPREDRPRDDRPREDRPRWREDRFQNDRPREDRYQNDRPRDERPREDRYQNDRPREDRPRDERSRDERPRDDRPRDDRPRDERFRERDERRRERLERQEATANADPMAVIEPRGDAAPVESGFRSQDGEVSETPAFLRRAPRAETAPVETAIEEPAGEARPPRRRRTRAAPTEGGEA